MPIESTRIYSRDSKGALRFWSYVVDGDKWRSYSGISGGQHISSGWTTSKPKNVGRSNATTGEEQAAAEAEAEFRKKLARDYRRTPEELDSVPKAPMLAKPYKELKQPLRFPVSSQPKLDGVRMMTRASGGLSRDYLPFGQSVAHILAALEDFFKAFPDAILDGELYNHAYKHDFNKIISLVTTKDLDAAQRERCESLLQYHVYDMPSVAGPFRARMAELYAAGSRFNWEFSPIVIVPTAHCGTQDLLDTLYDEYLANGFEGQIVRPNEPYEFGVRSWNLLKRKTFIDIEVPVVRLIEGNGNWAGIPKSIEYMLPGDKRDADNTRPKASIKGDEEFCRSLIDRQPKFATIRYFALTPAGIPRFPVATAFYDEERNI